MRGAACMLALLLCLGAGAARGGWAAEEAAAAAGEPEAWLVQVNAYSRQVKSAHLVVRTEAEFPGREEESFAEECAVWFDGVRARVEQRVSRPTADDPALRFEETWTVFDGERVVQASPPEFRLASVAVVERLSDLPRYVRGVDTLVLALIAPAFHQGLPLGDAIRAAGGEAAGAESVAGLDCQRYTSRPERGASWEATRSWWVAPAKGYALAQYREEVRWDSGETALKRTEAVVEEWAQVAGGVWAPRVFTKRVYLRPREGQEALSGVFRVQLDWAEVNTRLPESIFALELPASTVMVAKP